MVCEHVSLKLHYSTVIYDIAFISVLHIALSGLLVRFVESLRRSDVRRQAYYHL